MVMTMGRKRKHVEPMIDVQGMTVTTAKQRQTTKTVTLRTRSRVPQVFKSLQTLLSFVLCFVLILCFVSSMVFLSL